MAYKFLQSEYEKYKSGNLSISNLNILSASDLKQINEKHKQTSPVLNDMHHVSLSEMKQQAKQTLMAAKKADMAQKAIKLKEEARIKSIIDSNTQLYAEQFKEIADRISQNITPKLIDIFYNSIIVSACGAISFKSGIWPSINYFTNELSTTINNEIKFIGSECEYWNVDVLHKIALDRIRMYIHSYVVKAVTEYLQSKEFNVEVKCSYLNSNKDQPILKFSIHLCAKPKSTSKTAKLGMPTKKK